MAKSKTNRRGNTIRKQGSLHVYGSYSFVEKDPIIDVMRTAYQDSGLKNYSVVEDEGGPKAGTIKEWFEGKTRRPMFATIAAFAYGIGGAVQIRCASGRMIDVHSKRAPKPVKLAALAAE